MLTVNEKHDAVSRIEKKRETLSNKHSFVDFGFFSISLKVAICTTSKNFPYIFKIAVSAISYTCEVFLSIISPTPEKNHTQEDSENLVFQLHVVFKKLKIIMSSQTFFLQSQGKQLSMH